MANTKELLRDTIVKYSAISVLGLLGFLGAKVLDSFGPPIVSKVLPEIPNTTLLSISLLLLVICLIEAGYIAFVKSQNKFSSKFGIYWDKKATPHCPSCKSLLTQYGLYGHGVDRRLALFCLKCQKKISIANDDGNILTLKDAKDQILGSI